MAHAGKKVLLCGIGIFRIFARLFRRLPRYIHFLIHALQLQYLLSEHSEILIKYTKEHSDYGKGRNINDSQPMNAHTRNLVVQPVKRQYRHQIPFAVWQVGTVQMAAGITVLQYHRIILTRIHRGGQLPDIKIRLLALPFKNTVKPVKIIIIRTSLVPHHKTAVIANDIGIYQRTV